MREDRFKLLTNQSTGSSFNSASVSLDHIFAFSIQLSFTTSDGVLKLQASNDNSTWDDITASSQTISGSGSHTWNHTDVGFQWVRVVYTRTSGSGLISGWVKLKGV